MKSLVLSINPSYRCNFRCNFCYLTKEQLSSQEILPLEILEVKLQAIREAGYQISHVDLYGGEIALLETSYLNAMDAKLRDHGVTSINVITNLSRINDYFLQEDITLSVSYDFEVREQSNKVLENIMLVPKNVSILMLASPELIKKPIKEIIETFNYLVNVVSVEIKPYSSNQANQLNISFIEYEEYIKSWMMTDIDKKFEFINEMYIQDTLSSQRNAFSDNHVYLTPKGDLAVLEFDEKDNEYFLPLNDMNHYESWAKDEKIKVYSNPVCSSCSYVGRCLTEHYRDVKSLESSCNGFKFLLDWADANPLNQ